MEDAAFISASSEPASRVARFEWASAYDRGRRFQGEMDIDRSENFHWSAIDKVRLIPPVAYGVDRSAAQGLGALDHVQSFNRSGF